MTWIVQLQYGADTIQTPSYLTVDGKEGRREGAAEFATEDEAHRAFAKWWQLWSHEKDRIRCYNVIKKGN